MKAAFGLFRCEHSFTARDRRETGSQAASARFEMANLQSLILEVPMRGRTFGILLFAGLGLLTLIVAREAGHSSVVHDGCYTMNAPSQPTICN